MEGKIFENLISLYGFSKWVILLYTANDELGTRVPIELSIKTGRYFCPLCKSKLIRKVGEVNQHHFAHEKGSDCDSWYKEMSEWHRKWQSIFPLENRENVIEIDNEKHIADVVLANTVIEFQHSPISKREVEVRNSFYLKHSKKLVWVIDCYGKEILTTLPKRTTNHYLSSSQIYWNTRVDSPFSAEFSWVRPKKSYPLDRDDVVIILHVNDDCFIHVVEPINNLGYFKGVLYPYIDFIKWILETDRSNVSLCEKNVFEGFVSRYRRVSDSKLLRRWIAEYFEKPLDQNAKVQLLRYENNEISYKELKNLLGFKLNRPNSWISYYYYMDK